MALAISSLGIEATIWAAKVFLQACDRNTRSCGCISPPVNPLPRSQSHRGCVWLKSRLRHEGRGCGELQSPTDAIADRDDDPLDTPILQATEVIAHNCDATGARR